MNEYLLSRQKAETLFRTEYGKMVAVIARFLGAESLENAEDIVQETFEKAIKHWEGKALPPNPRAWLYTTAKNLTLNQIKRGKTQGRVKKKLKQQSDTFSETELPDFSEHNIADGQLKMMFVCCHPSLPEPSQIALILKILCGFSQSEIANAFFTSKETINKRLVRARKQLREQHVSTELPGDINASVGVVLKTIYLLFNEGYFPSHKEQVLRPDLCLEAIRLTRLLAAHPVIKQKEECLALLSLMYLNASRFPARISSEAELIDLADQDRKLWDQSMINRGIHYLSRSLTGGTVSPVLIMATISAHHCTSPTFGETPWTEILKLYDQLLLVEDSPLHRLNRSVALAKVAGPDKAIEELKLLEQSEELSQSPLFYATFAEHFREAKQGEKAARKYQQAISLASNPRDRQLFEKKLSGLVPPRDSELL